MNKPIVVLADLDANYLIPLEDKLTEELYDQIELEIITSQDYFNSYFSTPRKIDTLIISSDLYSQDLLRHNVMDIFVLTEEHAETPASDRITYIFKYSSTKEIFNQVLYKNKEMLDIQLNHKETQVVVVTSAIGGSGKTVLSLALASCLSQMHKRVLYISTDIIQSFPFYLTNKACLPNEIVRAFNEKDENLYRALKPYLRNESLFYLPAFSRDIMSLGMNNTIYNRIISAAKFSKEYDYIIMDTDANLDEAKAEIFQTADKVIVNVLQDAFSTYKTSYFVQNIDCRNSEKFIFVCNKFKRDSDNEYVASSLGQQFIITEYIDELPPYKVCSLDSFTELLGIKNLAYVFS